MIAEINGQKVDENGYLETEKSNNPTIAFFQRPEKELQKDFRDIGEMANEMMENIPENYRRENKGRETRNFITIR